jgi:hypothetical protein
MASTLVRNPRARFALNQLKKRLKRAVEHIVRLLWSCRNGNLPIGFSFDPDISSIIPSTRLLLLAVLEERK